MIDLDQLDAQLERALTADVRMLRSGPARPALHRPARPELTTGSAGSRTLAEKLASIADDTEPPPRAARPQRAPVAAAPEPAPPDVDDDDWGWLDRKAEKKPAARRAAPAPPAVEAVLEQATRPVAAAPAPPAPSPPPPPPPPSPPRPAPTATATPTDDDLDFDFEPEFAPRHSRPASVSRMTGAPFFEKRPSEMAPTARPAAARRPLVSNPPPRSERVGADPGPAVMSARERLRQAALRQAHGVEDDGSPGLGALTERIPALLAQGLLDDLDRDLAAHATMASRTGSSDDRLAAAVWKGMRATLDGRRDDARSALQTVNALGHGDDRYWTQRFWTGLEWGDAEEHYALLAHCWERAYRHDDLAWRGALCLLLARMGRADEATREVDAVLAALQGQTPDGLADIVTSLAESVFVLGDATRAASLQRLLTKVRDHLVVAGPGLACKGALSRFQAHVAATVGNAAVADKHFSAAVDTHRALGARPLLARTLREWGATLAGRDDVRAQRCLAESAAIARELGLSQALAPALAG